MRHFRNFQDILANFQDMSIKDQAVTFLALLQKTDGYYWAGLGVINSMIERNVISMELLDEVEAMGELHPQRIDQFKNRVRGSSQKDVDVIKGAFNISAEEM